MSDAPAPIVLLDVMGTLVHDPFYVEIPAFFGMTLEELIAVKHPTAWLEFELGAIEEPELLARFFADGRAFDAEGLKASARAAFRWLDGVEDVLAQLAARGTRMHALSNYSPWYRWIEERLGLSRYLEWSFVSCDTGVRKPAPEAFLGPARALDVEPGECLLIDDREANCAAARELGMPALRFENAEGLARGLRERGLV